MINKRLVSYLKEDKKYIYLQVLMQWLALIESSSNYCNYS